MMQRKVGLLDCFLCTAVDAVCCNNDMMFESLVLVIVNLPPVYEIFVAEVRGNKKGGKKIECLAV